MLVTNMIMHPDVVSTAFAIVNLVSRLLAITAPFLSSVNNTAMMWVFLVSATISAVVVNKLEYHKINHVNQKE